MRSSKRGSRRQRVEAEQKLKLMPQTIEFIAVPKVYDFSGTDTGMGKRPHWRKGLWRHQACGRSWKDHRWLFVAPMLIHREQAAEQHNEILIVSKDRALDLNSRCVFAEMGFEPKAQDPGV